ncbi:GNAT family N-acetyltransferase [Paenibacillus ginsengarvi]|uniref:GNAT family N-acetyltransferase n=1 Tax=Paenibacillus ginsengarvi TaxID=400777 RepID=A0A3B0CJ03_9BACL|nr:GNAT family N-acetyltransferase [Paenibacillus ginsengarvi]RKN84980.1 GNAT family N-acetyltransferase [Paenibacillus ginsengarvi]
MELRLYRSGDRERVLELHERALREEGAYKGDGPWDDDLRDIAAAYTDDGGEFWVGEAEGEIVAMGAFRPTSNDTAEIRRMRVAPELQGRGCGRLMLNKLEERAKERGFAMLHLDTTAAQTAAQALYESAGYSMHERRMIDGDDCYMYAKWLVPPEAAKPMTPEEEAKFYADWDLSQELTEYAKSLLREGATPERTMEQVLASKLYASWTKKTRSFIVEYEKMEFYEDLRGNVESETYIARIEEQAAQFFEAAPDGDDASAVAASNPEGQETDETLERVFAQMDIRVTLTQLACEMARFSRAVGLSKPIRYSQFLALFSGAAIVDMEQDDLDRLVANKELAIELAEAFAETYSENANE